MNNSIFMLNKQKKFYIEKRELPQPDNEEVQIRFLYCGICGGDYSSYIGRRKQYPISLGHEFVAEIIEIGTDVTTLSVGQRVISDLNFRCGKCDYCQSGKSHLCNNNNIGLFSNRGFAKYSNIHSKYLYSIPKSIPSPAACLIEPLSCVIHAIKTFAPQNDEPILINGVGSIGSMAVFYLDKVLKHQQIYVREPHPERLMHILSCFPSVIPCQKNMHCFNTIFECSNQVSGLKESLSLAMPSAKICIMSHLYGEKTSFLYEEICKKELKPYFPLRNGEVHNIYEAIQIVTDYWSESYNILYFISNNLKFLFANKNELPYNKLIIDLMNAKGL